jgi:o-succinylbenzoate synthase
VVELTVRAASDLRLHWRPFALALPQPLHTARGVLERKQGWLLRLEAPRGRLGWGEAAPLDGALAPIEAAIGRLGTRCSRADLEAVLAGGALPAALAFALGAALAECAGLPRGRWRPAPPSALLLPAGPAALPALEAALAGPHPPAGGVGGGGGACFKWKVAVFPDGEERQLLERLLERLPAAARLRLDANGGWERATAAAWARRLAGERRLDWLEQPFAPADAAGLAALAARFPAVPIALDESLQAQPPLRHRWSGWQVRRPSQEGDPRPLLAELERGRPRLMLSTGFETGIGARWLHHLAALQARGPTPAAPGLAPGWSPPGDLAAADPERVWRAAGVAP